LFGFEIATAAPVPSRLVQVFAGVESEMLFLERNTPRVAELKHQAERVRHLTINRWALPDTSTTHEELEDGHGYNDGLHTVAV
jgi:hypothetical protein